MFDVPATRRSAANWYTDAYEPPCLEGFDTYLRQVNSPRTATYFVVVTTGRASRRRDQLCDTAARFETDGTGTAQPDLGATTPAATRCTRSRSTGGAVYVGGHQRWLDNPYGTTSGPGPGAVDPARHRRDQPEHRQGPALEPDPQPAASACARSWSPRSGLLVGSDTDQLGQRVPRPDRHVPAAR